MTDLDQDQAWLLAAYRGEITDDAALAAVRNAWRSPVILSDPEAVAALRIGDEAAPDDPRRRADGRPPWEHVIDIDAEATEAFERLRSEEARAAEYGFGADDQADEDVPLTPADRIRDALLTSSQVRVITPPEPHIAGWLYRNTLAVLYGPAGIGKSFIGVDIALSTATGTAWHGHNVHAGSVLYVAGEGVSGIGRRIDAWEHHHGEPAAEAAALWLPWAVNLHDPAWAGALADVLGEMEPALVVIDTYARSTAGADENSAKDTGVIVKHLDDIRRASGACVLLIHHSGKDKAAGARGSSALRAAVDTELELAGDRHHLTLTTRKQKDAEEADPLHLALISVEGTESAVITAAGGSSEPARWDGPGRCMDAVTRYFAERPELELSQRQAVEHMTAHWSATPGADTYRAQTVREALERLCLEGVLVARTGARNARLFHVSSDHAACEEHTG